MSMASIRAAYGVPAKRGGRVRYVGDGRSQEGAIVSSDGQYLYLRFDGTRRTRGPFHPTWRLEYLETPQGLVAS